LEKIKTYHNYQTLLKVIIKSTTFNSAPYRDLITLLLTSTTDKDFFENFDGFATIICKYMLEKNIRQLHVREPVLCKNEDGSISGLEYPLDGSSFSFRAIATVGAGIYYYLTPLGGPTLLDFYENAFQERINNKNIEKLARSIYEKKGFGSLVTMERAFLEDYLPPSPDSESLRGYFHHLFYYAYISNKSGIYSYDRLGKKLALASLYYPEIAFWMPPLVEELFRPSKQEIISSLIERLRFILSIKPFLKDGILFPVFQDFYSEGKMDLWLDRATYLEYYCEDEFLKFAKRAKYNIKDLSFSELVEVYLQANLSASLCGATDINIRQSDYLFTNYLATIGETPTGEKLRLITSGPLLDSVLLPSLEKCNPKDIIAIRRNGEHLSAFRQDISLILDSVSTEISSGKNDKVKTKLSEFHSIFLKTRLDSLNKDLKHSSLRERIKNAGWSFSIGSLVGFAMEGNLLSSVASGGLSELIALGLKETKLRHDRSAQQALGRIYTALIDVNKNIQ
jgi:hypothetical protein